MLNMKNKNTVIGLVVALIIVAGLIVFVMQNGETSQKDLEFQTIQKGFNSGGVERSMDRDVSNTDDC